MKRPQALARCGEPGSKIDWLNLFDRIKTDGRKPVLLFWAALSLMRGLHGPARPSTPEGGVVLPGRWGTADTSPSCLTRVAGNNSASERALLLLALPAFAFRPRNHP
jgi:hypothetical protein